MIKLLIKKLIEGGLDVVMAISNGITNEYVESIPIFKQDLYLVVCNQFPLANYNCITADDFKNVKLIMIKKETDLSHQTSSLFKKIQHNT